LPPSIFFTSSSEYPLLQSSRVTFHILLASSSPTGVEVMPSKSEPSPRCPAPIKLYKKGIAHNLVSKCIAIGEAVRKAKEKSVDPKKGFVEASGAVEVFAGNVKEFKMEGRGGFNWGDWQIKGVGKYSGHSMRIWFKNEYLIAWIDDKPKITCPYLICVVEDKTSKGLSNFVPDATHRRKDVTVYGVRAVEEWRTPKGIEIFGPRHFGFDLDYVPF